MTLLSMMTLLSIAVVPQMTLLSMRPAPPPRPRAWKFQDPPNQAQLQEQIKHLQKKVILQLLASGAQSKAWWYRVIVSWQISYHLTFKTIVFVSIPICLVSQISKSRDMCLLVADISTVCWLRHRYKYYLSSQVIMFLLECRGR